jgi:calcineurin-like phosphoesterase family protein
MKSHKPIFWTSDWHLGHAKVIEFDKRPFKNLEEMHRTLIARYNATVPKDGVCNFLGDVGLCSGKTVKEVIDQLNGIKCVILGNHDKNMHAMYNQGFDLVLHSASIVIAGKKVTMSHCPLRGVFRERTESMINADSNENWHGEKKYLNFSVADEGQFHLHGHIHSGPANDKPRIDGRQFDVGVAANKYRPVSISEIESWICKYNG